MVDRRARLWRALWLGCSLWAVGLTAQAAFPPVFTWYYVGAGGAHVTCSSSVCSCTQYAVYWSSLSPTWNATLISVEEYNLDGNGDPQSANCAYSYTHKTNGSSGGTDPVGGVVNRESTPPYCPTNSTGTTSCTCNTGYSEDTHPDGSGAVIDRCTENPPPDCPAPGTPHVYTESHAPNAYTSTGAGRNQTCIGGCLMQGTGSATSQDGRVYTFPPLTNTGDNCTENENDEQPPVGCSWPQVANAAGTGCETPSTRETPPEVIQNPDGSTTERQTECTSTTCTTTETNTPSGGGGGTTTTTQTGIREYCADHPNTALCADIGHLGGGAGGDDDEGDGCMANPESENCGGPGTGVGDLYEGIGGDLQQMLGDFRDGALGTPMGAAVGGFFTVSAEATCPTWSATIPYIEFEMTLDQLCSDFGTTALAALRIAFLIVCAWYAFRVAIDN